MGNKGAPMRRIALALAALSLGVAVSATVKADDPHQDLSMVAKTLSGTWKADCSVRWREVVEIELKMGSGGSIIEGPKWINPIDDLATRAGAAAIIKTIVANQPYTDVPATIYDKSLTIEFDQTRACGQTK